MSNPVVRLDEPKQHFDKEESRDFMDEVWRYIDKLENRIGELEEYKDRLVEQLEIAEKEIRRLKDENK